MPSSIRALLVLAALVSQTTLLCAVACSTKVPVDPAIQRPPVATPTPQGEHTSSLSLIPAPRSWQPGDGVFVVRADTPIIAETAEVLPVARQLSVALKEALGFQPPVSVSRASRARSFVLRLDASVRHPEAYQLSVTEEHVELVAGTTHGLFYGVQTLRQLLPASTSKTEPANEWAIAALHIDDEPRFSYRGMHLDVGRHFFSVDVVKRYLDVMALFKLNTFHFHLTEDQGWRIEIKKYPRLTSVGAFRKETLVGHYSDQPHRFDGVRYGGFYTQEQIREIVAHAAALHIEVIPEIEMPGHSLAALAAYPQLACTPGPFDVATRWGIFDDIFCPKEETFEFLEDVLGEVIELFPGRYIHIGGDEAPKGRWEQSSVAQAVIEREGLQGEEKLQSYFIRRMQGFLSKKGRSLVGWDEILEGGLAPDATVMSWRGVEGGVQAAKLGHEVIMAPNTHTYFNKPQSWKPAQGLATGHGYLPLRKVYEFEPIPNGLTEIEARRILGAQGNLWTEYIKSEAELQRMVHPRLEALAEVLWARSAAKDWSAFKKRLPSTLERLEAMGVQFSREFFAVEQERLLEALPQYRVALKENTGAPIHYTLDGSEPGPDSQRYRGPILLEKPTTIRAVGVRRGVALSEPSEERYWVHRGVGARASYGAPYSSQYAAEGENTLVNGVRGTALHGDGQWQGFSGKDLNVTLRLPESTSIVTVAVGFLDSPSAWIFPPRRVTLLLSSDGENFRELDSVAIADEPLPRSLHRRALKLQGRGTTALYLRIVAEQFGSLPNEHPGAGKPAWLFVDEIEIE